MILLHLIEAKMIRHRLPLIAVQKCSQTTALVLNIVVYKCYNLSFESRNIEDLTTAYGRGNHQPVSTADGRSGVQIKVILVYNYLSSPAGSQSYNSLYRKSLYN
jgi:hypothetical protein